LEEVKERFINFKREEEFRCFSHPNQKGMFSVRVSPGDNNTSSVKGY